MKASKDDERKSFERGIKSMQTNSDRSIDHVINAVQVDREKKIEYNELPSKTT